MQVGEVSRQMPVAAAGAVNVPAVYPIGWVNQVS